MQEMQVQSLGQEDPREEEMATHSSILAWEILWTEEPGGLQSMGLWSQTWLPIPLILEIRSRNCSLWAKNQGVIGFILPGGSGSIENPFPCLFPLLEATHVPWFLAPFSIFKSSTVASSSLLTLTFFFLVLSFKDSWSQIELTWIF